MIEFATVKKFLADLVLKIFMWGAGLMLKGFLKKRDYKYFDCEKKIRIFDLMIRYSKRNSRARISFTVLNQTFYPFEILNIRGKLLLFSSEISDLNAGIYQTVGIDSDIAVNLEMKLSESELKKVLDTAELQRNLPSTFIYEITVQRTLGTSTFQKQTVCENAMIEEI